MTYRYKVTLSGIKGFYRIYLVNSENSLYSLHKQMRADMEFPIDQLILFKAFDENGAVAARYGLFDLGDGAVDQVTVGQTVKAGITSFTYFYDVTEKKSVTITLEGESTEQTKAPVLVDTKGPNPIDFENGYVAFEDLPDDQRHLPGEGKEKKNPLEAILGGIDDLDDEDEGDVDDDDDDEDDEEEEKEEETLIYDGSEELTL